MQTPEWIAEARKLERETFVARHPGWFLVVADRAETIALGFRTQVTSPGSSSRPGPAESEVFPIRKAHGNPYPDRISLGRARNCDVVVRQESVSKLHAHFRVQPGDTMELIDLGSQNGTRINDRKLRDHSPEILAAGDVLAFGSLSALFVDADGLFDVLQRL
jgi:hypothetical protein